MDSPVLQNLKSHWQRLSEAFVSKYVVEGLPNTYNDQGRYGYDVDQLARQTGAHPAFIDQAIGYYMHRNGTDLRTLPIRDVEKYLKEMPDITVTPIQPPGHN